MCQFPLLRIPHSYSNRRNSTFMSAAPTTSLAKQQALIHQQVIRGTLDRIASAKGVLGYLVVHPRSGSLLEFRGFNDNKDTAERYADKLHSFLGVVQSTVRCLDYHDDLTFCRLRETDTQKGKQREYIMAPDLDKEYILIVIQDTVHEDAEGLMTRDGVASAGPTNQAAAAQPASAESGGSGAEVEAAAPPAEAK
jgi:hypothetical protein